MECRHSIATQEGDRVKFVARVLKEPLFHFLVLAVGVFVLAGLFSGTPPTSSPATITVSEQRIRSFVLAFQRTWQRSPTREELDGLIEDYIREEVLNREALSIGLDRDDTMIRRRLRQKMEFIAEDMADAAEPTDEELQEYLNDHPETFRIESRLTFRQVYLKPSRHGESLNEDAQALLSELRGNDSIDATQLGDPTLLPHHHENVRKTNIADQFGPQFADEVLSLGPGKWDGPIESAYGLHVVLVEQVAKGETPDLDKIRNAVRLEWHASRRSVAKDAFVESLREKYDVVVENPEFSGRTEAQEGSE